jgi:hypothetical protein
MKKFVFLMLFAFFAGGLAAQPYITLAPSKTFADNRITSADIVTNTEVLTYTLETGRHVPYTYDIQMKVDTVTTPGTNSGVSVQLIGKKFENDSWTNIGAAVVWKSLAVHAVGADTTINWNVTSAVRWRYVGVKLTGAGTHDMQVTRLSWKLWEE